MTGPKIADPAKEVVHDSLKPQRVSVTQSDQLSAWTVSNFNEMELWIDQWDELSQSVEYSNSFYSPTFLLAAAKSLSQQVEWRIILVKDEASENLVGFFPFIVNRGPLGLRQLSLWKSSLSFLTTPLIHQGYERQVFEVLLKHIRSMKPNMDVLDFSMNLATGGVHQELHHLIRENLLVAHHVDYYSRAELRSGHDYDEYLTQNIGRHHFREYRRQLRRMNNLGQLEFRSNGKSDQGESWADWFLELETKSWKGEEGSALKQNPEQKQFFRELVSRGTKDGSVQILGMFLDGEPVAMICSLISQRGSFAYKIAFDQEYKKYSPGMLVQLHKMNLFLEDGRVPWFDSCAIPNHSMINRLWFERRPIELLKVSVGGMKANLVLGMLPLLRALKRTLFRKRSE